VSGDVPNRRCIGVQLPVACTCAAAAAAAAAIVIGVAHRTCHDSSAPAPAPAPSASASASSPGHQHALQQAHDAVWPARGVRPVEVYTLYPGALDTHSETITRYHDDVNVLNAIHHLVYIHTAR